MELGTQDEPYDTAHTLLRTVLTILKSEKSDVLPGERFSHERSPQTGFDFSERSDFARGHDNVGYSDIGSRDRYGQGIDGPDWSGYDSLSGYRYRPRGPRQDYRGISNAPMEEFLPDQEGFGQSYVAQDVGWAPGPQGRRGGGFRQDNRRQAAGPYSRGPGYSPDRETRQRFGGSDYMSRSDDPRGRHHVGDFPKYTRGARAKRSFQASGHESPATMASKWKPAEGGASNAKKLKSIAPAGQPPPGAGQVKQKSIPESWTSIGDLDVYKGTTRSWKSYLCSLCRYQTLQYASIKVHMASKMHNTSLMYITNKTKEGPMISKFVNAYIFWKNNRVKRKLEVLKMSSPAPLPEGNSGAMSNLDLDETMEVTRTAWCRACTQHVADIPTVVMSHAKSRSHIEKIQVYREHRKKYVLDIASSILRVAHNSTLFEEFKMNPGEGQKIMENFYAKLQEQRLKDKATAEKPQSTEESLQKSDSQVEQSIEVKDVDNEMPQKAKPEDTHRSLEDGSLEADSVRKVDSNHQTKSCSVATEEGSSDLTGKGTGQGEGGPRVEKFERKAKQVKKCAKVSDADPAVGFEDVKSDKDQEETASNAHSNGEEYEELDNYDVEDDDDFEAWEVVQCEADARCEDDVK